MEWLWALLGCTLTIGAIWATNRLASLLGGLLIAALKGLVIIIKDDEH